MKRILCALLLCFVQFSVQSACAQQVDSLVFATDSARVVSERKRELRFTVDALAFFRDNEYNSKDVMKGYTLPGMWLKPTLSYQPLNNLSIEAGAYMLHYWGANKYPNANYTNLAQQDAHNSTSAFHCAPVFRVNLQVNPHVNVVLGSLYGKSAHQLVEPLYNSEMNISADPENGVQLLWNNSWLHFDTWIDWRSFIFKNDDTQERFTYGLSARFMPSRKQANAQWYLPLQLVMQHVGGEINTTATDRQIKTWLNAAAGAGVRVPLSTRLPVTLGGEVVGTYFSQQAGNALPFNKGYGVMAKAQATVWHFGLTAGYWQAHQFIPILGSPLFGAVSHSTQGITFDQPRMVFARFEFAQKLGYGFSWGVQVDFDQHWQKGLVNSQNNTYTHPAATTDFAAGIYLRMTPSFLIKKFKATQVH